MEGLFGPDGRFREDTFHKLLQGMRNKRETSGDLTDFQSTFNTLREDKPKGNFYVRYIKGRIIRLLQWKLLNVIT